LRTLARGIAWLFVIGLGLDIGAGLYESVVVVPFWSRGVPGTLAEGSPFAQVAIRAGVHFWSLVTPAVAVLALATLFVGLRSAPPAGRWMIVAAVAELCAAASTLFYFRPTLINLLLTHGAGLSSDAIAATVNRWVALSWIRVAISAFAWLSALRGASLF